MTDDIKTTNENQCTIHLSGARSDTKQAVKELREALAVRAKEAEEFLGTGGMCEPPDDEPLLTASIRRLPAVLDRLEELENGWPSPKKVAELITENADLRAERDAERARFLEFRAAVEEQAKDWSRVGNWGGADLSVLLARFPVEPEAGR
jgi:hypothetical protein